MLTTVLLPLFIASHTLQVPEPVFQLAGSTSNFIVAAKPRKGDGPDHGDDPHDEQHDGDLPANAHKWDGHPSGDPYGGTTPNDKNHPFTPY